MKTLETLPKEEVEPLVRPGKDFSSIKPVQLKSREKL
jgi:hypothetical protein